MSEIELSTALEKLRSSLEVARVEGADKSLKFLIEDIELELNVEIKENSGVSGGVKIYIAQLKVDGSDSTVATQKIKLKMKVWESRSPGVKEKTATGELLFGGKTENPLTTP